MQARRRALSDATEVPMSEDATPIESFEREIKWRGHSFFKVRLFHPRQECLGTVYQADPVCEEPLTSLPMELLSITFVSHYYTTNQGLKKLKQVESELQRLASIRHPNLLAVLAAKLTTPSANSSPRLLILTEQRPSVTLHDVLEDTDHLREDCAQVSLSGGSPTAMLISGPQEYLTQILSALQAVHHADIVHRGMASPNAYDTILTSSMPRAQSAVYWSSTEGGFRVCQDCQGFQSRLSCAIT